jgi:integrase
MTQKSNPIHQSGRSGSKVTHSKDRALNEREFELLMEGARELSQSDYYYKHDPEFVIYTLGRLGLRRGELAHMSEDWINWRKQMIEIPTHDACSKGVDGEICGDCKQLAKQRVEYSDTLSLEEAMEWMWVPKTEAASRDIYFGFDTRAEMYIERYFSSEEYSRFEASGTAISRRVKQSAELALELNPDEINPHALRATAATYHSGRLKVLSLMQFMGWCQPSTAKVYFSRNGDNTARQLNSVHMR